MLDGIGQTKFNEAVTSGSLNAEGAKKEESASIFSEHDKNFDGKITKEEMGIGKMLKKILDMLPNAAGDSKSAKVINHIRNIVQKLGADIEYDTENTKSLDAIKNDVIARRVDAEGLQKIAVKLKDNKSSEAVKDFEKLELYSETAVKNADEGHNANAKKAVKKEKIEAQMNDALKTAVDIAMTNAGKVDIKQIPIETIQGLKITSVDVSRKDRLATGTSNDKRVENGIERNADGIIVTLTYDYNGETKTINTTVNELPNGYAPKTRLEERTVNITEDKNPEAYFD